MAKSKSVSRDSADIWVGTSLGILKGVSSATKHVTNYIPGSVALLETDKMKEVCAMCWEYQSKEHLYCISHNGMVHCFNCVKRTFVATEYDCCGEDGQFVGLGKHEETVITCTDKGALTYWSSGTIKTSCSVGTHVSTMVTSPDTLLQVATGGRENNLKLWDGHNLSAPVFQAKNVKNDKLDLRVPIWVSAVGFVPDNGVQPTIAVGTGYHEVRLYDTRAQRRPVSSHNFGEASISALAVADDGRSFFIGNSVGELARFDTRTGGVVNQYKGFAGAVKCIQCYSDDSGDSQIAACGLDRYLRVYSVAPAKLICQVYLKLQSSSLLFNKQSTQSDSHVIPAAVAGEKRCGTETLSDSEGEDNDVWKEMETIGDKSKKKNDSSKKIKLSKSKKRTKMLVSS